MLEIYESELLIPINGGVKVLSFFARTEVIFEGRVLPPTS